MKEMKTNITVLEYVIAHNLTEFYCYTDEHITIQHTHKSRKGREIIERESFMRLNRCVRPNWEVYNSFNSFSNASVVSIDKNDIIVHFTLEDWIREVKDIFLPTNKRDYNYSIIYHNQIYPINAD